MGAHMRAAAGVVVLAVAFVGAGGADERPDATSLAGRTPDRLVFSWPGRFGSELWTIGVDGRKSRVTTHALTGGAAQWVRKGRLIAFVGAGGSWLMKPDGSAKRRIFGNPDAFSTVSPDATRVAWLSSRGDVVISTTSGRALRRIPLPLSKYIVSGLEWSPDGCCVATSVEGPLRVRIVVVDVRSGSVRVIGPANLWAEWPVWSPDGSRIAFAGSRRGVDDLWVMDADGSRPIRLATDVWAPGTAWAPDGRSLAFLRQHTSGEEPDEVESTTVHVTSSQRPDSLRIARLAGHATSTAWSRDSRQVALVTEASLIVARRAGGWRRVAASERPWSEVSWAPTDRILFNDADGAVVSIRPNGRYRRPLTAPIQEDVAPRWAPDGQTIAFVRRKPTTSRVLLVGSDGRGPRQISSGEEPTWSPDGREIRYVRDRGVFRVDRDGGRERRVATFAPWSREPSYPVGRVAWSPDGRRLAFVRSRYVVIDSRSTGVHELRVESTNILYVAGRDGSDVRVLRDSADIEERDSTAEELYRTVRWSPDGSTLAVHAYLWDAAREEVRGARRLLLDSHTGAERSVVADAFPEAWSRDGRKIAAVSGTVVSVASDRSRVRVLTLGSRWTISSVEFSSDGRLLAIAATEETEKAAWIFIAHSDGSPARRLVRGSHPSWRPPTRDAPRRAE